MCDGPFPVFYLNVVPEMCNEDGFLPASALSSVFDGCTIMRFVSDYDIKNEVVSLSMHSRYLHKCKSQETLKILTTVRIYNKDIATIEAAAYNRENLVSDSQHTVYVLKSLLK